MDIFAKYFETFNNLPPILMTIDKDDETYIKLVKNAIETKKRLTNDDLAKAFGDDYDLIESNFDPDDENDLTLEKQLEKDAKDEQEAVEGYDKTLKDVKNNVMREQINHIRNEEIAHKKYLEEAKKNPNAKYKGD